MIRAEITGLGGYLPPKVLSNEDLEKMMDTNDEWIIKRTGIKTRHWVTNESTSDLAYEASKLALEDAKVDPKDIDLIIYVTITPDYFFPGDGCILQRKLGMDTTPAFDIRQQCSGFIYGLSMADQYIKSGMFKKILLVGAEVHSKGLDRTTKGRDVAVLFGDGAGAVVVEAKEVNGDSDSQVFSTHLHAQGEFAKELWVPAPGMAMEGPDRITKEMIDEGLHYPSMNGKKVFVHAIKRMCESIGETLEHNQKRIEDVNQFFFHQANLRINQTVSQNLSIPEEKVYNTIQRFGNTTAATIPLGMFEARKEGRLKKGDLIALSAFGSGFTWASALLRY